MKKFYLNIAPPVVAMVKKDPNVLSFAQEEVSVLVETKSLELEAENVHDAIINACCKYSEKKYKAPIAVILTYPKFKALIAEVNLKKLTTVSQFSSPGIPKGLMTPVGSVRLFVLPPNVGFLTLIMDQHPSGFFVVGDANTDFLNAASDELYG